MCTCFGCISWWTYGRHEMHFTGNKRLNIEAPVYQFWRVDKVSLPTNLRPRRQRPWPLISRSIFENFTILPLLNNDCSYKHHIAEHLQVNNDINIAIFSQITMTLTFIFKFKYLEFCNFAVTKNTVRPGTIKFCTYVQILHVNKGIYAVKF